MEYYIERKGLILPEKIKITKQQLRKFWCQIYFYFKDKKSFELAEHGKEKGNNKISLKLAPSPEQFFLQHIGNIELYPIDIKTIEKCSDNELFTLIEIYYDVIEYCEWEQEDGDEWGWCREKECLKREYCTYVNNILKFYENGYYLEPNYGFIMEMPNSALKHQLEEEIICMPDNIYSRLSSAIKNYYRFDCNEEGKRKAIASLADILEPIRKDLNSIFTSEVQESKQLNDKLIFEIVNKYGIRHNDKAQILDYSVDIWYDWMMQYYTSTIIAFYRLKNKYNGE